jgi:hypothetical protein
MSNFRRLMKTRWQLLACSLACSLMLVMLSDSTLAQETGNLAALLTIQYPDVSVRLVTTEQWLPLPQDAVAPLTVGDSVQTDEQGRALLTFDDAFEILLLPNSTLTLDKFYHETDGRLIFAATLEGHALHRSLVLPEHLVYALNAGEVTITQPAAQFGVWSSFEDATVVTVTEASAEVAAADEFLTIETGQAFYMLDDAPEILPLTAPFNAARLIGETFGCPGSVDTGAADSLNVRVGPGLGYTIIGYIPNGGSVRVVGINENGSWLRVQKYSGFAWIDALAVTNQCEGLTVYPRLYTEMNAEAFAVLPAELELLVPFYDNPAENLWFYRSLRATVAP